jgi:hypothetical protein
VCFRAVGVVVLASGVDPEGMRRDDGGGAGKLALNTRSGVSWRRVTGDGDGERLGVRGIMCSDCRFAVYESVSVSALRFQKYTD